MLSAALLVRLFKLKARLGICCLLAMPACIPGNAQTVSNRLPPRSTSAATMYAAFDTGEMNSNTVLPTLRIVMAQSQRKTGELHHLIRSQTDPHSPLFHKWLSAREFGDRFGADPEDLQQVKNWLLSNGFERVTVSEGQQIITFTGTVASAQKAFQVEIHSFAVNGRLHHANLKAPSLPPSLLSKIRCIQGLDDFAPEPASTLQISPLKSLSTNDTAGQASPADLAAAYNASALYREGIEGAGTRIAVVGAGAVSLQDYRAYKSVFGLPQNDFTQIVVPGASTTDTSAEDNLEATLDLEIAGGIAPAAQMIYVRDDDIFGSVSYIIDNKVAQIISMSYTTCELPSPLDSAYEALALQAATEGMTWLNASGDSGAAGCDPAGGLTAELGLAVNLPASVPEVTGVGGTTFTQAVAGDSFASGNSSASTSAYIPETAWNAITAGEPLLASGGGLSKDFYKPDFQSAVEDTSLYRHVPDVAFDAGSLSPDYQVVMNGQMLSVGGTSASTPLFAGVMALVTDHLVQQDPSFKGGLGNINPELYRLNEVDPAVFHDVTTGSNAVSCQMDALNCTNGILGYYASAGYDMVTGLGSLDAYKLATEWSLATFSASTTSIKVSNAGSDGSFNAAVTVETAGDPSNGTVVLQCYNPAYSDQPFDVARFTVDASGNGVVQAQGLPGGSNQISADFQGTRSVLGSTSQAYPLAAIPEAAPSTVVRLFNEPASTESGRSIPLSVVITGTSIAPTGIVNFYFGSSLVGSAEISSGVASSISIALTGSASGALVARYSGNAIYPSSSSAPLSLQVSAPSSAMTAQSTPLTLSVLPKNSGSSNEVSLIVSTPGSDSFPNGKISFFVNGLTLGDAVPFVNGTATGTFSTTMTGFALFTAIYDGDQPFQGTTSAPVAVMLPALSAPAPDPGFNLVAPTSLSVGSGVMPTFSVAIHPTGTAPISVALTCTANLPGYSCTLPSTVEVTGNTNINGSVGMQEAFFVAPFALLLFPFWRGRRVFQVLALTAFVIGLSGCGLTVNNPKAFGSSQSYVLTITARAGAVTHTAAITIKQNQSGLSQ